MAFFNKDKKPSLDELYKILESLGDEDKKKIKERFFDAERDEVKAYANKEIAKDDAEEGRTEEAKKEDEKASEEKSESDTEENKVEDEVDESVGEEKHEDEEASESEVDADDEEDKAKATDARLTALEEKVNALMEKLSAVAEAHEGGAFGASARGNYEERSDESGDRAVMASYNRNYRG